MSRYREVSNGKLLSCYIALLVKQWPPLIMTDEFRIHEFSVGPGLPPPPPNLLAPGPGPVLRQPRCIVGPDPPPAFPRFSAAPAPAPAYVLTAA